MKSAILVLYSLKKEVIAYYEIPFVIGMHKNVTTGLFPKTNELTQGIHKRMLRM